MGALDPLVAEPANDQAGGQREWRWSCTQAIQRACQGNPIPLLPKSH
jgi:hypothetical protein